MRLACGICLSSQSDARAKGTDANEDWVAVTDCGHVYHASCLNQWTASKPPDARMCPCKCAFRNVKCDKQRATANGAIARRSNMQEPMPLLKLFLTGTGAGGAPSSDAILASDDIDVDEEEDAKPPRKRLRPDGKGKARAVPEQEEEDSDIDEALTAAGPSNAQPDGGEMRRQWMEAMATVREQRAEIARLNATNSHLLEQLVEAGGDISPSEDEMECIRERVVDPDETPYFYNPGTECYCNSCKPTTRTQRLKDRVEDLEARLEIAETRWEDLEDRNDELHEQISRLEDERDKLGRDLNALSNDHQTARVRWREAEKAYTIRLQQAGESGTAIIKQLRDELEERDKEITHLKANLDGVKYHADKETKKAQAAVASAQASASSQILQAIDRVKAAEARLAAETQVSRRHAAANAQLNASIAKMRQKLNVLRSKRGVVGSDSDAEDATAAAPVPGPSSSRTLKRTTSSRSNFSLSPPASPTDAVRINNNSTLLGNSPRKQRHSRSAFDNWNLSREEERPGGDGHSPVRPGSGVKQEHDDDDDDDDDELEYVDVTTGVPTAKPAPVVARAKPSSERVIELSDDDSEVDVVASSYFSAAATKGPARVAGRPSASAPSSTTSRRPPAAAAAGPFATLTNSISGGGAVHPLWKKAAAAAPNKQDKHLPDFSKGRVDTGAKRHVKRK